MKNIELIIDKLSKYNLRQWIILVVIILLILFIINKFILPKLSDIRYSIFGAKTEDGTKISDLSENRKEQLRQFANSSFEEIESINGDTHSQLVAWNNLQDNEFIYAYEYIKESKGKSLACMIDVEFMPFSDEDEKFIQRVENLKIPTNVSWSNWLTGNCNE